MRSIGLVTEPRAPSAGDHLCWVYEDDEKLQSDIAAYLLEGIERGERVGYVHAGSADPVLEQLNLDTDVAGLRRCGEFDVLDATDSYASETEAPAAQVDTYAAATASALAHGYSGYRVAAEATPLVRSVSQRRRFCDYEHLIDRYMAENPFTAMCCYDRRVLGAAVGELACVHPLTNADDARFCIAGVADGTVSLHGEVDTFNVEAFRRALTHVTQDNPGELVVDATDLAFINHKGLLALSAAAQRVHVTTTLPVVESLVSLLGLPGLSVDIR